MSGSPPVQASSNDWDPIRQARPPPVKQTPAAMNEVPSAPSGPDDPAPAETSRASAPWTPSDFQRKALWSALAALSVAVIGALAVGAVLLGTKVLGYLQPVLVPLAVAGVIAYLLQPVVSWIRRRTGLAEQRAVAAVYAAFLLGVALLLFLVLMPTFVEARSFLGNIDDYQKSAKALALRGIEAVEHHIGGEAAADYYSQAVDWVSEEAPAILAETGAWLWARLRGAFGFFGYLIGFLLVPVYLYYFLREGRKISQTWSDYLPLRASEFKDEVVGTLTEINAYLISFFRGQMVVSLIDGALVAVALTAIGLPYAMLLGVFLAILGLIPYLGNLLVMIPAVLIAVAHFGATAWAPLADPDDADGFERGQVVLVETDEGRTKAYAAVDVRPETAEAEVLVNAWRWLPQVWAYPLIVIAIFIVLQQINGFVTAPKIVGDSVGLHPLTVIFSILFWSLLLGGLLGAILAVPLTASVKVLIRRYVWENRIEPAMARRADEEAEAAEAPAEA